MKRVGGRRVGQGGPPISNNDPRFNVPNVTYDAQVLSDEATINQAEEFTDTFDEFAVDQATGDRIVEVVDRQSGAEALIQFPAEQQMQPDLCEFPAQALELTRDVMITNSTPQVRDVRTDVCGNAIGYTETMTCLLYTSPSPRD